MKIIKPNYILPLVLLALLMGISGGWVRLGDLSWVVPGAAAQHGLLMVGGFLGTLIAAVQALYALEASNGDSGEFSRLLAEALVTSAAGLAIGVMATLAHHFLYGRVRSLVHDFEWVGHTIHEFLTTDPGSAAAVIKTKQDSPSAK